MWGGKQLYAFIGGTTVGAGVNLTAENLTYHKFTIPFRCTPIRSGITLTTVMTTWAATLKFTGAGGTAGNCGTIIVPADGAVGAVYYEDTDPTITTPLWTTSLHEGDQVVVALTCPDGNPGTGAGVVWMLVEVNPEQPGNNSAMHAV